MLAELPIWLQVLLVSLFGLAIGSFANTMIYRIPRFTSVVTPGSRCPQCAAPIRFFDNIPLVSFILLGGRCRNCGLGRLPHAA